MANEKNRDIGGFPNANQESLKTGKNHLLAIGIDAYQDKDIPTLSNCVSAMKGGGCYIKEVYMAL